MKVDYPEKSTIQNIIRIPAENGPKNNALNQLPETNQNNEFLREEVARGFLYTHSRANTNTNKLLEVASFSYSLIELLNEKGLISIEQLDQRKQQVNQRLAKQFSEKGMGVAFTKDAKDKYDVQNSVTIDCESRLSLCRAACCRMRFALAVQDVEEGLVKWNLGQPYMIRQKEDGYCFHLKTGTHLCKIYKHRPFVCRAYDCRQDQRIWQDFEQKIVSPDLEAFLKRPWLLQSEEAEVKQ